MKTIFTSCPECYDGFGTVTVEVLGTTPTGDLRRVEVEESAYQWQMGRYLSGGQLTPVNPDPFGGSPKNWSLAEQSEQKVF